MLSVLQRTEKPGSNRPRTSILLRSHTFFLEKIVNGLQGEKNVGDNVVTTLNYNLQQTAYQALGNYDGAVVVLEASTGKVLAMVSKPDYDPNKIAENWEKLTAEDSDSTVLLNRATQGLYPPGSVFKIFTTLEYVHENPDYEAYSFDCNGSFTSGGSVIHCYNNKRHGTESLSDSFANSCNSSYASIGLSLDANQFETLCEGLLFNKDLPVKFESSKSSFALSGDAGDSIRMETAIGQGKTLVTPMHMAMIASAIANDGVLMNPYVVDHTENYEGIEVDRNGAGGIWTDYIGAGYGGIAELYGAGGAGGNRHQAKGKELYGSRKNRYGRVFYLIKFCTFLVCGLCGPGGYGGHCGGGDRGGFRCRKRVCGSGCKENI